MANRLMLCSLWMLRTTCLPGPSTLRTCVLCFAQVVDTQVSTFVSQRAAAVWISVSLVRCVLCWVKGLRIAHQRERVALPAFFGALGISRSAIVTRGALEALLLNAGFEDPRIEDISIITIHGGFCSLTRNLSPDSTRLWQALLRTYFISANFGWPCQIRQKASFLMTIFHA